MDAISPLRGSVLRAILQPPVHIIITTGKVRPLEIPANALFIPKPYVGKNVVAAMRTFENMN